MQKTKKRKGVKLPYHSRPASAHNCAHHPALVDRLAVDNDISIAEGYLVVVIRIVVVHGSIRALKENGFKKPIHF